MYSKLFQIIVKIIIKPCSYTLNLKTIYVGKMNCVLSYIITSFDYCFICAAELLAGSPKLDLSGFKLVK